MVIAVAMKLYPIWALPLAFVIFELGIYFHRKQSPMRVACAFLVVFLCVSAAFWIYKRGDQHAGEWVREVFEGPLSGIFHSSGR